jgi:hypothetical protein
MAYNITEVSALVKANYGKAIGDNIYTSDPLLAFLKENDGIAEVDTSAPISMPIKAKAYNSEFYVPGETKEYEASDTMKSAIYQPVFAQSDIVIPIPTWNSWKSKEAVVNGVDEAIKMAINDLKQVVSTGIYTDTENGFVSLEDLIKASGTVGGIDPTTDTYWKAEVDVNTGYTDFALMSKVTYTSGEDVVETNTTVLEQKLNNLINKTSNGSDRVKIIIAGSEIFNLLLYASNLKGIVRNNDYLARLGFVNFEFNGIPVVLSNLVGARVVYGLNTAYTKLKVIKDFNFSVSDFRVSETLANTYIANIDFGGALITNNRRMNFRLDATPAG